MHPIRDFSKLRWLMLCSVCAAAFAGPVQARNLVPDKPSVEVNLNALRELQAPAIYQPTPMPAITYAPPPSAQVPAYMPDVPQRQVPAQQYGTPAPTPVRKAAPKPKPVAPKVAPVVKPQGALPPPPSPIVQAPPSVALPPITPPKVEIHKSAPVPAPKPLPSIPAATPALSELPPPMLPPMDAPVLPKIEAPKVALPKAAPALPSLPKLEGTAPSDLALPPQPTGTVNVPSVDKIRGPEPDISGLNFSNLPNTPKPAVTAPAPMAKKAAVNAAAVPAPKQSDTLPIVPVVAPTMPSLPPPPKGDTGPLLIPVPKPAAPLPPSVTQRLGALNPAPNVQGIVSDKTVVEDHVAEIAARKKLEAQAAAKVKADQQAAAAQLKQQQVEAEAARKASQADASAKAKADADAKLKAETELAAAKKSAEDKAKADAAVAKKAALKLPPAALPPPVMPSVPAMPDPLAKSNAPVKLGKSDIAALPAFNATPPTTAALPVAPSLPKAPTTTPSNPNLPKLPTLTIPGTKPDQPLPSLTAITGGDEPTTADIMQPRDSVDSAPLMPAAPSMPDSDLPTVKRELPEINVGAAPAKNALPIVTSEKKTPPALPSIPSIPSVSGVKAEVAKVPSMPPAPTVTPKTEQPVMVASAPAASTGGSLETSISFGPGSSALNDGEKSALTAIAEKARKGGKKVRIVGYAAGDADKAAVARKTAFARANIIRAFLLSKGMSDAMIHAQALGNQVSEDKADIFLQ